MKEHAVPQNIMSVDFKLFGSWLTLREFIFIGVSLAAAYLFYLLMKAQVLPPLLAWPIILTFGLGGPVVALVPFQERRLDQWLISFLLAIRNPTKRVWKKKGYEPMVSKSDKLVSRKDMAVASPLANLTKKDNMQNQTTQKASNDIDRNEEARLNQISKTMQSLKENSNNQQNQQAQNTSTNQPTNGIQNQANHNNPSQNSTQQVNQVNHAMNQQQVPNQSQSNQYNNETGQILNQTPNNQYVTAQPSSVNQNNNINPNPSVRDIQGNNNNQNNIPANTQRVQQNINQQFNPAINQNTRSSINNTNPNFAANTNNTLTQSVPNQSNNQPQPQPQPQPQINGNNNSNIGKSASENPGPNTNVPISQKLEFQDSINSQVNTSTKNQVLQLSEDVVNKIKTDIPGLTVRPNIVNIVVKDKEGKVLTGVVCITKKVGTSDNGKAVRAGISNPLGQIVNNIPLKNGSYKIILTKKGYNLPEIEVNLNGQTIPAVEIRAL